MQEKLSKHNQIVAKKRFKMYKAGKNWFYAPIVFLGIGVGLLVGMPSHAAADELHNVATTSVYTQKTPSADSQSVNSTAPASTAASQSVNSTVATSTAASQSVNSTVPTSPAASQSVNSTVPTSPAASQSVNSTVPTSPAASQSVNSTASASTAASQSVNSTVPTSTAANQTANSEVPASTAASQSVNSEVPAIAGRSQALINAVALGNDSNSQTATPTSTADASVKVSQLSINNDPTPGAITVASYGVKITSQNTYAGTVVISFDPKDQKLYGMRYSDGKVYNRALLTSSTNSFGLNANLVRVNLNGDGTYSVIGYSSQDPTVALLTINNETYYDRSWKAGYTNQPTLSLKNITVNFLDKTTGKEIQPAQTFQEYNSQEYKVTSTNPTFYTLLNPNSTTGFVGKNDITRNIYFQRNKVTINPVDTSDSIVTGTGFPGEIVKIQGNNNTIIGTVTIDNKGDYTVVLSRSGGENEKLTANSYVSDTNTLDSSTLKVVTFNAEKAKATAKDTIDKEAAKVTEAIKNDATLSAADKAKQIQGVADATTAAKKSVDNAANSNQLTNVQTVGIKAIDGQHVSGTSVDDQKTNVKAQLDQAAAKVSEAIKNDATLSAADKAKQIQGVADATTAAKNNVDQAVDNDGITKAQADGVNAIDSQHVGGTKVDDQKANAKAELDQEAAKVTEAIKNDATLSAADKAKQIQGVADATTAAKNNVDKATDNDGITKAQADGSNNIDSQHVSGTKVDDQKTAAKAELDQEAAKVTEAIKNDATLSAADKAKQVQGVAAATTAAKNNVDKASDNDGITKAQADGINAIDGQHVSGTKVDDQKTAAKAELDQEAAKVTEAIKNDATLSAADKAKQVQGVAEATTAAKNNVDKASDNDGIAKAQADGVNAIDGQHIGGTKVDDQKTAAKDELDQEAAKITEAIKNDATLLATDKAKQIQGVADATTAAKNNVDQANDNDGITKAQADGVNAIDGQHVSGTKVDDQKTAAKAELDQEAAKITEAIKNDATLLATDKAKQIQGVADATTAAKNNVDQANDNDGITKAQADGVNAIDGQHVSGTKVDDQKANAKAELDQAAAKVTEAIKNDATLSATDKAKQIQGVADATTAAKNNVDKASNNDGITKAQADGVNAIDGQHVSGTKVDDQKANAKAELDQAAAKVTEAIKNDATLSAADKAKQIQGVADATTAAKNNVDKAVDNDGITKAQADGINNIDSQHVSGTKVDDQKTAAKAELDQAAAKVTEAIKNDATLSVVDKAKQIQGVADATTAAKNNVDKATDNDGITKAQADGVKAIDGQHVSGTKVDDQKANAKAELDQAAAKVTEAIKNDATLSAADKAKQIQGVADATTAAKNNVDKASDNDGIAKAQADGINAIDGQHVLGVAVDQQKAAAKAELDQEAAKVTEAIKNDATLSAADKAKQVQGVVDATTAAKNNVDKATDNDGITKAQAAGVNAIDSQHVGGTKVDDQKAAAKAELDQEAAKVTEAIKNDATLSAADKAKQIQGIAAATTAAKNNVDQATDNDGIARAERVGIIAIDGQHLHGLEQAKTKPAKNIEKSPTESTHVQQLPKTDEQAQMATILTIIGETILGLIGVLGLRHRKEDEK